MQTAHSNRYELRKRKSEQESVYVFDSATVVTSDFSKTVPVQLNQSKDSEAEIIPEECISIET